MHSNLSIAEVGENCMFYDIETDHQHSPYCTIKTIGVKYGLKGTREIVQIGTQSEARFCAALQDCKLMKFSWNGCNFDNIVMRRHGFEMVEENLHDLMLAMKTVAPALPSYSLKYCNFHYFGDMHMPEMELEEWAKRNDRDKWEAPSELLDPYCLYDVHPQTTNMFRLIWDVVTRKEHWAPYLLDLSNGVPLNEMMMEGGLYLDETDISKRVASLQWEKLGWEQRAFQRSSGRVENPNSTKQMGLYLLERGFQTALTDAGAFSVPKKLLIDLLPNFEDETQDKDAVIRCTYEVRRINSSLKYFENYVEALQHCKEHRERGWIPSSFSISRARTRRYLSDSMYKLNFQNANEQAKEVQLVPPGFLGVWIDSTQVENVVHIYESHDTIRRRAYESDTDWNEYVWLCNRILGGDSRTKKELDSIPSPQMPHWSIYKQFKTIKLALNFGMGVAKFCSTAGVDERVGTRMFDLVHEACPAIHSLQRGVANRLATDGFVADAFGHRYSGNARGAYKVVAYLIQGCGTGSLPKAQIRANFDTLREYDKSYRGTNRKSGVLCGTTHDEQGLRLDLRLGAKTLIAILQKLMFNMTDRFSPVFDNIPLRAKLYLSRTTAGDAEEVSINDLKKITGFCV